MIARAAALTLAFCAAALAAEPPQPTLTTDRASGVYGVGDRVTWTVRWEGDPAAVTYVLKRGGLTEVAKGALPVADDVATIEATFDEPGALLLEVKSTAADGTESTVYEGAIASPGEIPLSAERPADFDDFWASKLTELDATPVEAQVTPGDSGRDDLAYATITMNNIRGARIHGQIARPVAGEKFPAMLIVQWAGVYGLDKAWALGHAGNGWLVLNILAHDLPIDESPEFYREQGAGPLKNYWAIGNDDRETSYYLRMYLACYRAAEYLTTRPDWDGRVLVVQGGSQGGQQALVTAALHPKITAAFANVPAGCDVLGQDVGRMPGWPQWTHWFVDTKDRERVREAARYYDVANFTPRITCPVLIGVGLEDRTCPPAGIVAAANRLTAPKEVILMPGAGHQNESGSHGPYHDRMSAWLSALKRGEAPPVGQ